MLPSAESIENVNLLLSRYPDAIREADEEGKLPLHVALDSYASDDVVTLTLLEKFPEAARTRDSDGNLPLHYCGNHLEITKELINIYPESITALNDVGNMSLA